MKLSYSRVECFRNCPYQYKLRYIDKLKTIYNCDPQNALTLGTAIHTGIEYDAKTAAQEYYKAYPVIDDLHINETIKFDDLIPKAQALLPAGQHEVKIENDDFIGYVDLLVPTKIVIEKLGYFVEEDCFSLYDFKYSNNVDRYLASEQLHVYKYFYELLNPGSIIDNLYYVFIPKTMIRQKKTEDLYHFRKRLQETLKEMEVQIVKIDYQPEKVISFLLDGKRMIECVEFEKKQSKLCGFCEYETYCTSNGENDLNIIYKESE